MKIECWPRYVDPEQEPDGQYAGWPITVSQADNYARTAAGFLDELQIEGATDPVVAVVNEESGETEYMLRIKGNRFRPKVFAEGKYTVKISEPDSQMEKSLTGLVARMDKSQGAVKKVTLS